MAVATETSAMVAKFKGMAPPDVFETYSTAKSNFTKSFNKSAAIKPVYQLTSLDQELQKLSQILTNNLCQQGDTLPTFSLPNALGKEISSKDLLSNGPLLITFYRGAWCPFCEISLHSLQKHLAEFKAKGVTLVAITPELPDNALSTKEKNELQFEVLSDVGNVYATKLGLLFQQPEEMRGVLGMFGTDLKKYNGDDSFALPVPATLLVDKEGKVRNAYVEPDWTQRMETTEALKWVDEL
ncbi:hypothetical protein D0Z07_7515 [Hyphodiscus hymeniophilus]|uniref:thioredoxin-dependent peroxiredoxin n=1 Tax=Hyphodiscus hymeniophilus TaxID=353542 RepID=A0A9P6VEN9_9HELO|nr:hypothetical protein D0Z07_7515 [Hyphodiscus hymeniophilus]